MPSAPPAPAVSRLQEWSALHPQLLWVYRGEVHPLGRHVTTHGTNLVAWLLLKGGVETRCDAGRLRAATGQWIFPSNRGRTQRFSPEARILSVSFRIDWPGGEPLYDPGGGIVLAARQLPELGKSGMALCEAVERLFPNASNHLFLEAGTLGQHWEIHLRFADWLRAFADAMARTGAVVSRPYATDERLGHALLLIDQLPLNRPFRQRSLARSAGLSVAHLNRLFAQHLGKTPRARFEERRLQAATMLLEQSDRPLKAISADLGFSSPPHFSRWFRKRLRVPPGRHRRAHARN